MNMIAYTDYPLRGVQAVKQVELLGWDGNKYCLIRYMGREYNLKLGYIYTKPGVLGEVPSVASSECMKDVPIINTYPEGVVVV